MNGHAEAVDDNDIVNNNSINNGNGDNGIHSHIADIVRSLKEDYEHTANDQAAAESLLMLGEAQAPHLESVTSSAIIDNILALQKDGEADAAIPDLTVSELKNLLAEAALEVEPEPSPCKPLAGHPPDSPLKSPTLLALLSASPIRLKAGEEEKRPRSCPSAEWSCDEEPTTSNWVDVMGFSLPAVSVKDSALPHVCISDVFQTFFSSRHWDEFKSILERNTIRPVVADGDMEVMSVDDVRGLLLNNQARRDGFVRCLKLSNSSANFAVGHVKERQPGQLESGIKTRHSDQSDICYVEIEGRTLPSVAISGVQYVRLVDVVKSVLSPETTNVSVAQLEAVKASCAYLGIPVERCTQNVKARLTVYANSFRSSSLHVMAVEELSRLVAFERENRGGVLLRKRRSQEDSMGGGGTGKRPYVEWESSSCDPSPLSRPTSNDSAWSAGTSGQVEEAPERPLKELTQRVCRPYTVDVGESPPVPVLVANGRGHRGVGGLYYNHLFANRHSACIQCNACEAWLTVKEFVSHWHGRAIPEPRLMMQVEKASEARFDLWEKLCRKLRRYSMKRLAYQLPAELAALSAAAPPREKKEEPRRKAALPETTVQVPLPPQIPIQPRRRVVRGDVFDLVVQRRYERGIGPQLVSRRSGASRETLIEAEFN